MHQDPSTLIIHCPVDGSDSGEPVAVGSELRAADGARSWLALQCEDCSTVYLSPAPDVDGPRSTLAPPVRAAHGALRSIPPSKAVGCYDAARSGLFSGMHHGHSGLHVTSQWPPPAGSLVAHDAFVVAGGFERSVSPVDDAETFAGALRSGGRLVAVSPNAASTSFRRFSERHWAGYDFPNHRQVFTPDSISQLLRSAGYTNITSTTLGDASMWERSADNMLKDIEAPSWMRTLLRSRLARWLWGLVEAWAERRDRGSWFVTTAVKP